ncbi:caffeic acid 3-O-methyltransferase-like [Salvia miltiorrhiza]|uniref:caffeic acid 3-O-methyltransferase-like n=1 Tax=Salvia miltiorrhiza TaxID=226208 RepID=UPI0025AC1064|nr:caffeic acid 3-O-methyltransferase-like [Salvia miltiorrhiza]
MNNYKWCSSEEEASSFALQLTTACALPAALKCAVELNLLELIKKAGPSAPTELAAQITTANPQAPLMIDRILRLLAANNILLCTLRRQPDGGAIERLYSLAPVCDFLTKNEDAVSFAPLVLLNNHHIFMQSRYHLKDAVVEGGVPFKRAHGMGGFEYLATDPRCNQIFNQAMSEHSSMIMRKILQVYKGFEGVKRLVDVGGGTGASLNMIMSQYPSIKALNFDLPHVIQAAPAPPHMGMEHVSGDMFVSVPQGDAIFIKWICHNWGDEECSRLLKNCHKALSDNGKVVMVERIISEIPNTDSVGMAYDVTMLAFNGSGKERTEMEFQALAKASGFKKFHKVVSAFGHWVMEMYN